MKLYIKQKVFSWGDKFTIFDSEGNPAYYAEGEVFTIGKKLHLYDLNRNEVAYIEQEILTFLPKYYVYLNGSRFAHVKMEFSFFKPLYSVCGPEWTVKGEFWQHDYEMTDAQGRHVASISKEWFTLGDAYELNINDDIDKEKALAVLLCIDAAVASQSN